MKRKVLSLLLTLALCLSLVPLTALPAYAADSELTVGNGTATSLRIPTYGEYNYSKDQYIIPASELTSISGHTITALKWYLQEKASNPDRKLKVILSEMQDDTMTSLIDVSGEPVLFEGTPVWSSSYELLVTFDTPYNYNGGNLLVTVLDVTGRSVEVNIFYGMTRTDAACYTYGDSAPFNADFVNDPNDDGGVSSFMPKTTLFYGGAHTEYDLWVGGERVTSANASDLSSIDDVGGTASYDATTNTLTLNNATIKNNSAGTDDAAYSSIYYSGTAPLIISAAGTNTIEQPTVTGDHAYGIYSNNDLVFEGTGIVDIAGSTTGSPENNFGLFVNGNLSILEDCTVNAQAGKAVATYFPNSAGAQIEGGKLTMGGSASATFTGGSAGYSSSGFYIQNKSLTFSSESGWSGSLTVQSNGAGFSGSMIGWTGKYFYVDPKSVDMVAYDTLTSTDGTPMTSSSYYFSLSSSDELTAYDKVVITPVAPITVFFEVDGGQVSPASKIVMPGENYGDLPTPQKDGFAFDGWILCEGGGVRLIARDYYTNDPLFRLATSEGDKAWDSYTQSNFIVGSTIVFDVTFNDTTPTGLEINDRNVASSLYTIDGNHIYGRIEIISDYINGRHHFMDIITANLSSDYTIDKFYVIDPNGKTAITADSTVAMSETHALLAKWVPAYTVNIGPGKYMSLDSGTGSQTVLDGSAMTDVVYKADEGYYFPADYETTPVNGIGVTRNSFTQITVSGTPTANTTFYPADATVKTKPATPSVSATDCTTESNDDGTITGVDNTMEYQKSGDTAWTAITGSTVEGLTPGAYSVRIAETDTTLASDAASVSIAEYVVVPKVDAPAFTPASGTTFTETLDVTISIPDNATVYYTTDKSDPSETNGIMTTGAAITLTETTTLKAIAISTDANYDNSAIVTATYSKTTPSTGGGGGATTYPVTPAEAENGKITVSPENAAEGDKVTITVTPDEGYELDKLTVKDKDGNEITVKDNGDGTYTVTMPASEIEVEVEFKEAEETPGEDDGFPFVDVPEDAYYRKPVEWAVEKGITAGVSEDEYGPELSCTRAQVVTFLWITCGSPDAGTATGFDDVDVEAYYDQAVAWAVEQGITAGTSEGEFGPDMTITRAQFVTMLWVANGKPEVDGEMPFKDVPGDSYYAKAVAWAYANDITAGKSADSFGPDDPCTRGQIMTFLYNAYAE